MDYTFCPLCATRLQPVADKVKRCPSCQQHYFPKVGACTVGIVHDGRRLLLDRRAFEPGKGLWALLGGYLEPNELPEAALQREVEEESGLIVTVGAFIGIGVGGPTCGLFYEAIVVGGTLRPSLESLDLAWFTPGDVPWNELAFPRHRDMLAQWLQNGGLAER